MGKHINNQRQQVQKSNESLKLSLANSKYPDQKYTSSL
jgi:hypothetical protein